MTKALRTVLVSSVVVLILCSFQTRNVTRKAEELRRSGAAQDMAEAIRMAEDFYWPESDRMKEREAKLERMVPPPTN